MTVRERVLGTAWGWQAFKTVTGGKNEMSTIAGEYLDARPGRRILDVGCGFGDMVEYVKGADYVGVDLSQEYIDHAKANHGDKGQFVLANLTDLPELGLDGFDVAVAVGVLHHLTNDEATAMLAALPAVLKPGGKFIAVEPVWHPEQKTTARVLAALDRGRYVRDEAQYTSLVDQHFDSVTTTIRTDLFWFPYTHCIIEAQIAD